MSVNCRMFSIFRIMHSVVVVLRLNIRKAVALVDIFVVVVVKNLLTENGFLPN